MGKKQNTPNLATTGFISGVARWPRRGLAKFFDLGLKTQLLLLVLTGLVLTGGYLVTKTLLIEPTEQDKRLEVIQSAVVDETDKTPGQIAREYISLANEFVDSNKPDLARERIQKAEEKAEEDDYEAMFLIMDVYARLEDENKRREYAEKASVTIVEINRLELQLQYYDLFTTIGYTDLGQNHLERAKLIDLEKAEDYENMSNQEYDDGPS